VSVNHLAPRWRILASFAAIYLLWGGSYLGIRIALETLPPFLAASLRFLLAGSLLYLLAKRGEPAPSRAHWRSAAALGFLMFMVGNGLLMLAQRHIPSGLTATLYASTPFWFALLGWLWIGDRRPTGRTLLGIGIGFVGIALLLGVDVTGVGHLDLLSLGMILFSAFIWAFASLFAKRLPMPASPLLGAGMNLLCGGVFLGIASLLTGEVANLNPALISAKSLLAVVYLALGPSLVAFSSYMWLLTVVPSNQLATYAYVNPVIAVFLGVVIGGEVLTPRALIASAIIIGAVVLMTTAGGRKAAAVTGTPPQPGGLLRAFALRR
jgi:drug/metabolite transporter (DMT)-like permease